MRKSQARVGSPALTSFTGLDIHFSARRSTELTFTRDRTPPWNLPPPTIHRLSFGLGEEAGGQATDMAAATQNTIGLNCEFSRSTLRQACDSNMAKLL
jgi:hypothetical protein